MKQACIKSPVKAIYLPSPNGETKSGTRANLAVTIGSPTILPRVAESKHNLTATCLTAPPEDACEAWVPLVELLQSDLRPYRHSVFGLSALCQRLLMLSLGEVVSLSYYLLSTCFWAFAVKQAPGY